MFFNFSYLVSFVCKTLLYINLLLIHDIKVSIELLKMDFMLVSFVLCNVLHCSVLQIFGLLYLSA